MGTYVTLTRRLAEAMDEEIVKFFGSREAAQRQGDKYEIVTEDLESTDDGKILTMTQVYRIRPKEKK